jgi:hypothetical protein
MKTGGLLKLQRVIWCTATIIALLSMASLAAPATAAQEEPKKDNQKNKETGESKKTTVRIIVLTSDPSSGQPDRPLANATVKIQGEEDSYETDENGKTRTLIISFGTIAVVIKPTGSAPCRVDASITESSQLITVIVDRLGEKAACSIAPKSN